MIKFDQVWSILDRSDPKKSKNKTAIFLLFKNVTTLYTNIFCYVQPLKSFFSDRHTYVRKPHRHRSSNSILDIRNYLMIFHHHPLFSRICVIWCLPQIIFHSRLCKILLGRWNNLKGKILAIHISSEKLQSSQGWIQICQLKTQFCKK